jgi:tRNA A58 N-methylase Trm61
MPIYCPPPVTIATMQCTLQLGRQIRSPHFISTPMYSVVRDVCEEGFDLIDAADAVFLDLPHPWKVVPHAKIALKVV